MGDGTMVAAFVEDGWYAAAWSDEISARPLVRRILGKDILLFRQPDGVPTAMANRCPHRFAPLAEGVRDDGTIHCPYHGLRFDGEGTCIYNPHGPVPRAARIRRFATVETAGMVWLHPGSEPYADPARLPDLGDWDDRVGQRLVRGMIEVKAGHGLIFDNLLDLSHVEFLHSHLANAGAAEARKSHVETAERSVTMTSMMRDQPITALYRKFWPDAPDIADKWSRITWYAPAIALLSSGWVPPGGTPEADGRTLYTAHFVTPATETSSYYFWSATRRFALEDRDMDRIVRAAIELAFADQDRPMIEAQQRNFSSCDSYDDAPILLLTDRAAGQRQRIVDRLLADERLARETRVPIRSPHFGSTGDDRI